MLFPGVSGHTVEATTVRDMFDSTGQESVDPQDPASYTFADNVPSYHTMESVLVLRNRILKNNIPPSYILRREQKQYCCSCLNLRGGKFPSTNFSHTLACGKSRRWRQRRDKEGEGEPISFGPVCLKKLLPDGIPKTFVFVLWLS